MTPIREKTISRLQQGDTFSISRTFTESETFLFADMTRDYNPVHFDDRFASVKKLGGRICHGLLVGGMVTEIGGQIGWLASGMNFRFKKPVYFGDTVECRMTITRLDTRNHAEAEAVFTNQQGETVIEATLSGVVPGIPERAVMRQMVDEGDPTNGCAHRK